MKILVADFIYTEEGYIEKKAVAFDNIIRKIDDLDILKKLYPNSKIINTPPNSIIYPGFINSHVHLEFSNNKTTFKYGSFVPWLKSVIKNMDLVQKCTKNDIKKAYDEMLNSGITAFGEISSNGNDLEFCVKVPQRVVFYNEIIGSKKENIQMAYELFMQRVERSMEFISDNFIPAISIHSPYSTHPDLIKKAVSIAKAKKLPISAHLLESKAEKEWIEDGKGEFYDLYSQHFGIEKPINTKESFLKEFDEIPTHFIHFVNSDTNDLKYLKEKNHSIAHCPRSNRLLGCGVLDVCNLDIPWTTATDGLSSNWSLNIFDELRSAIMLHANNNLLELADKLILSITSVPAAVLNLNCGKIAQNKYADIAVVTLPDKPNDSKEISLWTILYTKRVKQLYIGGVQYV